MGVEIERQVTTEITAEYFLNGEFAGKEWISEVSGELELDVPAIPGDVLDEAVAGEQEKIRAERQIKTIVGFHAGALALGSGLLSPEVQSVVREPSAGNIVLGAIGAIVVAGSSVFDFWVWRRSNRKIKTIKGRIGELEQARAVPEVTEDLG